MGNVFLNCYGVTASIKSEKEEALENIRRDFSYFVRKSLDREPDIHITVYFQSPHKVSIPELKASMYKITCICYDAPEARFVDYFGRALTIHFFKTNRVEMHSEDLALLHELSYMTIQTLLGEALERKGLHRIHGLGLSFRGRGVLCLLPSGAGKTTLALNLMNEDGVRLLSEDTPLLDKSGFLYPFPLRIGICAHDKPDFSKEHVRYFPRTLSEPKFLVDIEQFQGKIAQEPVKINFLIIGERISSNHSGISSISKLKAIRPLLAEGVFCMNVPQYLELFLRFRWKELAGTVSNLIHRSIICLKILRGVKIYKIVIGTDKKRNTEILVDFLDGSK